MSVEKNVQVVKDFFAAIGSGDKRWVRREFAGVGETWRQEKGGATANNEANSGPGNTGVSERR